MTDEDSSLRSCDSNINALSETSFEQSRTKRIVMQNDRLCYDYAEMHEINYWKSSVNDRMSIYCGKCPILAQLYKTRMLKVNVSSRGVHTKSEVHPEKAKMPKTSGKLQTTEEAALQPSP
uniref:FLYWCH-type domain-containing protein n=1 Tax=Ascaris lumbricoides TaxID=6252 RepID=A0A0M3HNZ3_ASCLU